MSTEQPQPDWRYIPGLDNRYKITRDGVVYTDGFHDGRKSWMPSVRKIKRDTDGYLMVGLKKGPKHYNLRIAPLICELFNGPKPTPTHQVNHKNGIKSDNRPENLEWVTSQQNTLHGKRVLLKQVGESHHSHKLTETSVRNIRSLKKEGRSLSSLANRFGVNQGTIHKIVARKTWIHVK